MAYSQWKLCAARSPERRLPDWVDDPDCRALCEDIANLCWELARKQAAIGVIYSGAFALCYSVVRNDVDLINVSSD